MSDEIEHEERLAAIMKEFSDNDWGYPDHNKMVDEIDRLRNLTAADHIAALVAMGAKLGSQAVPVTVPVPHHRIGDKSIWGIEVPADRVLILPPEMTP